MSLNPWLAMVALDEPALPPIEQLAELLQTFEPPVPPLADVSRKGAVVTFRVGEATAALTLFPMPIPWQHLEGPCECAWYWPDAADTLREHRAHILVNLLDDGRGELRKAMLLTQLVAAVAALTPAAGIVWGPGRLVHPPRAFIELARSMLRDELPLYLWVDFRIVEQPDGSLSLFTTGLESLGQSEIEVAEFRDDVTDLRAAIYNIAHYALDKEKHIKDGETIGVGAGLAITARRAPSMLDAEQEVIRLEF